MSFMVRMSYSLMVWSLEQDTSQFPFLFHVTLIGTAREELMSESSDHAWNKSNVSA